MGMKQATMALLLTGLLGSGCVTAGTHQAKLDELARAQADLNKSRQEAVDLSKERDELKKRIQDALAQVADLSGRLSQAESKVKGLTTERDQYAKLLNDSTALVGQLKERLEKLGQNVDKLTTERGQLQAGLTDAKTRLEEMRKQKAAAEARLQMFRSLVDKLRAMIDAGQLKVITREGRMLIALPDAFGTKPFLRDAPDWVADWTGFRPDSAPPRAVYAAAPPVTVVSVAVAGAPIAEPVVEAPVVSAPAVVEDAPVIPDSPEAGGPEAPGESEAEAQGGSTTSDGGEPNS